MPSSIQIPDKYVEKAPQPVFGNLQIGKCESLEGVLFKRKLQQEKDSKLPEWLQDASALPKTDITGGARLTQLPPESHSRWQLRIAASAGNRNGSRNMRKKAIRSLSSISSKGSAKGVKTAPGSLHPRKRIDEKQGGLHGNQDNHCDQNKLQLPKISSPMAYLRPLTGVHPPSSPKNQEKSEKDKYTQYVIENLKEKCQLLTKRLTEVEAELKKKKQLESISADANTFHTYNPTIIANEQVSQSRVTSPIRQNGNSTYQNPHQSNVLLLSPSNVNKKQQLLYSQVDLTVKDMESKINSLKDVYTDSADIQNRDKKAAMSIFFFVSKIIAQRRYRKYKQCLTKWRKRHQTDIITVLTYEIERQKFINGKAKDLLAFHNFKVESSFVHAWKTYTKELIPIRKYQQERVQNIQEDRQKKFMKRIIYRWSKIALGPDSRKGTNAKMANRRMLSRQQLFNRLIETNKDYGLLTQDMINKEMKRMVMDEVKRRGDDSALRRYFARIKGIYTLMKEATKEGRKHYRICIEKKLFYPWREWAFLNASGIAHQKWKGPGHYVLRYNQSQVDELARRRLLKISFRALASVTKIYIEVNRRHRLKQTLFIQSFLHQWHILAKRNMKVRKYVIAAWKEYPRLYYELPFKLWFLYTEKNKIEKRNYTALIRTFQRNKKRNKLYKIMKYWRHQAKYGKTTALYTRFELIKSLGMHKDHTADLVDEMYKQEGNITDMEKLLNAQDEKLHQLQEQIQEREETIEHKNMMIHHCEEEVMRVQSIIECLSIMYPNSLEQIMKQQPNLNVKDRGLLPLAGVRLSNEEESRKEGNTSSNSTGNRKISLTNKNATTMLSSEQKNQIVQADPTSQRLNWALQQMSMDTICQKVMQQQQSQKGNSNSSAKDINAEDKENYLTILARLIGFFEFIKNGDTETFLNAKDQSLWKEYMAEMEAKKREEESTQSKVEGPIVDNESTNKSRNKSQTKEDMKGKEEIPVAKHHDLDKNTKLDSTDTEILSKGEEVAGKLQELPSTTSVEMSKTNFNESIPTTNLNVTNSISNMNESSLTSSLQNCTWPHFSSETPQATKRTWGNLLLQLNAHMPTKRKTETIEDALMRRFYLSRERVESILQDHFEGNPAARQFDIYSMKLHDDLVTANEERLKEEKRKKEEENKIYIGTKLEEKMQPDEPVEKNDEPLIGNGDPIRTFNVRVPKIDELSGEDEEDDILDDEEFMTPLRPDESDDSENEYKEDDV